jgi:hypothetical protein
VGTRTTASAHTRTKRKRWRATALLGNQIVRASTRALPRALPRATCATTHPRTHAQDSGTHAPEAMLGEREFSCFAGWIAVEHVDVGSLCGAQVAHVDVPVLRTCSRTKRMVAPLRVERALSKVPPCSTACNFKFHHASTTLHALSSTDMHGLPVCTSKHQHASKPCMRFKAPKCIQCPHALSSTEMHTVSACTQTRCIPFQPGPSLV